ncbi:MAG: L-lactate permease, partial [Mobilicoccus sp.]|nr:L-lactate permease [Mobilicoccus sp.]
AVFDVISDDPRVQAIVIAFCFGGMMEALAGFGAPVAITGVMLMAVGFSSLRAATVVLLANTAPVAFGAIGTPILTAGRLTETDPAVIGAYVGHQTPIVAVLVPLLIIFLTDGRRGVTQVWPLALITGLAFGVAQWVSATFISMELTDIISSLAGLATIILVLRFWKPVGGEDARASLRADYEAERAGMTDAERAESEPQADRTEVALTGSRVALALFPYLLVIAVFSLAKLWRPAIDVLAATDVAVEFPVTHGNVFTAAGALNTSTIYQFTWLSNPGTILLLCSIVVALVYRMSPGVVLHEYAHNAHKMRFSFLTVAAVLGLAYVMNLSGQTISIGTWIAGTGAAFAFLSPILGWLGTAVTGSDTSANALFATLQQAAAQEIGLNEHLLIAANTSGGVVGKMISPQNLTIAATAVGLLGRESEILRRVIWWSVGLLVLICLLVGLQSTPVLEWMLPSQWYFN